jgi:hypothetical protein
MTNRERAEQLARNRLCVWISWGQAYSDCTDAALCGRCLELANAIEAALREAAAEALAWQPIETAPHEQGRFIIGADRDGVVAEAFSKFAGYWRWVSNGEPAILTHWMPLPAPPGARAAAILGETP